MSETELSVICKNCGSEVSPYVTECPYCGARLRKRAPKLERRGDGLEAQAAPAPPAALPAPRAARRRGAADRPYATLAVILGSAVLLLVQKATGDALVTFGGLIVPLEDEWWRFLTAPFAYVDVGYLFVVAVGLAIFGDRRSSAASAAPPTALLLLACGSLGMLAASGIANAQGDIEVIAGGNGMALGAVAAWFAIRRAEAHGAIDQDYDVIGVVVAAAVLLALPIFDSDRRPLRRPGRRRRRRPRRARRLGAAPVRLGSSSATRLRRVPDESELEAAIERLLDAERFAEAERIVARAAPQLQKVLAAALAEGGWFGESHEAEALKAATVPDPEERIAAVRALLAEEARMGMMVGVAVGWALKEEMSDGEPETPKERAEDGDQVPRPVVLRAERGGDDACWSTRS